MAHCVAAGRSGIDPSGRARVALAAVFLCGCLSTTCSKADNDPDQVAKQFVSGLESSSRGAFDEIFAWDAIAINDNYVTRDFLDSLQPEKKVETLAAYKNIFYEDYLPLAAKARYTIDKVYIARNICDVIISVSFPENEVKGEMQGEAIRLRISLKLDPEKKHWYIVNLGDFFNLNLLRGDFDPNKFYLRKPISP